MKRIYRVLRAAYAQAPFDGEGSYRYGGRWSGIGTRLAYASEHQSLAMLEYFVHLDANDPPEDLVLVTAQVPDEISREQIKISSLPDDWRATPGPPDLARWGDDFVKRNKAAVLIVPSALATRENNWLINPRHAGFSKILVEEAEPLHYDARMFEKPESRRRKRKH